MSKITLITKKTEVITLKTGPRGPQGVKGDKGNQWRGAYSGATAYVVDDVVSYLGSSYICILASTNNLPTNITFWSLFAATGTANASNVTNTPAGNISATNVQNAINELDTEKVDKIIGKGLSTEDYTTAEKAKVANLPLDTNARLADIEVKRDWLKITNMLLSGDFTDASKWSPTSNVTIVGGVVTLPPLPLRGVSQVISNQTVNDKIYIRIDIIENTLSPGMVINSTAFSGSVLSNSVIVPVNTVGIFSVVTSIRNAATPNRFVISTQNVATTGSAKINEALLIVLTPIFGAGNEPTKTEMDTLINLLGGWFDGEITITEKQLAIWTLNLIRQNRNAIVALGGTIV